jgi:hypothetical protein
MATSSASVGLINVFPHSGQNSRWFRFPQTDNPLGFFSLDIHTAVKAGQPLAEVQPGESRRNPFGHPPRSKLLTNPEKSASANEMPCLFLLVWSFGWIESNHVIIVATEIMKAKEYL